MLATILHLIPKHPAIKVLIVGDDIASYHEGIKKHLCDVEGSVDCIPFNEKSLGQLKSREYEVALVVAICNDECTQKVCTKVYKGLENSGILILLANEECMHEMIALLEVCDYRAPNSVEIKNGRTCIVAKKLHMWGNGL